MTHSYVIREVDGAIMTNYSFITNSSHRDTMIQFKKHHFTEAAHMLVTSDRKRTDAKEMDVHGMGVDVLWMGIKRMQLDAKGGGTRSVLVKFINPDDSFHIQLILVALRLRMEYDTECHDGLPEAQFLVSDVLCTLIGRWLRILTPVHHEAETVLPIHLIAFLRLLMAQRPEFI